MTIDFYYMDGSPPSNSVSLLAKLLGIKLNMKLLDYLKNEHKTPEFIKINPQHTAPTINDNGFIIAESRAILGYLVDQYGKDDSLYPKDPKQRTLINQRLYFDIGTLYQNFLDYYCAIFETGKLGDPSKLTKLEEAFQILDKYLEGQNWVAGNKLTIADISIVSSVASCVECGDFDVKKYPNVSKWYAKVQKTLPGYDDIVPPHSAILKNYLVKYSK